MKILARNKKALHDYFILERLEAGVELRGTEVKSVRMGRITIKDSWCSFKNGQIFVNNVHIRAYEKGNMHALEHLIECYEKGIGVPIDLAKANKLKTRLQK